MWRELVSEDETSKRKAEEIQKSNEMIISFLETENRKYKAQLEVLEYAKQTSILKINESEKARHALAKEIKRMKEELKFEILAREGMTRKCNTMEYENLGVKDEIKLLSEELKLDRRRLQEVENSLSLERRKRLQDIHEIDILRKKNAELTTMGQASEKEAFNANKSLVDKLQRTETVLEVNESQRRVIDAQAEEMNLMLIEITTLKENQKKMLSDIQKLEISLGNKKNECKAHEEEVWRLRREIITGTTSQTQRSVAYHPSLSTSHSYTDTTTATSTNNCNNHLPYSIGDTYNNNHSSLSSLASIAFSPSSPPSLSTSQPQLLASEAKDEALTQYDFSSYRSGARVTKSAVAATAPTPTPSYHILEPRRSHQKQMVEGNTTTTTAMNRHKLGGGQSPNTFSGIEDSYTISTKGSTNNNDSNNNTRLTVKSKTMSSQLQQIATLPVVNFAAGNSKKSAVSIQDSTNSHNSRSKPYPVEVELEEDSVSLTSVMRPQKTLYLGSGLGLRNDKLLEYKPTITAGSAKSIINKILTENISTTCTT